MIVINKQFHVPWKATENIMFNGVREVMLEK